MRCQQWAVQWLQGGKEQCYGSGIGAWGQSGQQQSMVYQWGGGAAGNYNVVRQHNWA